MNTNEKDGMRYPSIDKLTTITHSKYKLIVAAAKRAKDLNHNKECTPQLVDNPNSVKAIGIALEEIVEGKILVVDATEENDEFKFDDEE